MRAEWDGDDLRHVADGSLKFTPPQEELSGTKLASCYGSVTSGWSAPEQARR
jgi:hypothetical protein